MLRVKGYPLALFFLVFCTYFVMTCSLKILGSGFFPLPLIILYYLVITLSILKIQIIYFVITLYCDII